MSTAPTKNSRGCGLTPCTPRAWRKPRFSKVDRLNLRFEAARCCRADTAGHAAVISLRESWFSSSRAGLPRPGARAGPCWTLGGSRAPGTDLPERRRTYRVDGARRQRTAQGRGSGRSAGRARGKTGAGAGLGAALPAARGLPMPWFEGSRHPQLSETLPAVQSWKQQAESERAHLIARAELCVSSFTNLNKITSVHKGLTKANLITVAPMSMTDRRKCIGA